MFKMSKFVRVRWVRYGYDVNFVSAPTNKVFLKNYYRNELKKGTQISNIPLKSGKEDAIFPRF